MEPISLLLQAAEEAAAWMVPTIPIRIQFQGKHLRASTQGFQLRIELKALGYMFLWDWLTASIQPWILPPITGEAAQELRALAAAAQREGERRRKRIEFIWSRWTRAPWYQELRREYVVYSMLTKHHLALEDFICQQAYHRLAQACEAAWAAGIHPLEVLGWGSPAFPFPAFAAATIDRRLAKSPKGLLWAAAKIQAHASHA